MSTSFEHSSRRSFLKFGAAAVAGAAMARFVPLSAFAADTADDPFGGLKMGIQSYSLRDRSFEKMLGAMQTSLKAHAVELYPNHLTGKTPPQAMELLKKYDVVAMSYGVIPFKKDEAANRKMFDLAKTYGMTNLSCDPDPDSAENVDKLCAEYKITAAIHPHGPKHRYGTVKQLDAIFEGRSNMFGICADTGHLIRAGEDPLKVIEKYKDRLHALHLKDFKKTEKDWEDVPAGTANLDVDGIVKFLLSIKFQGGIFVEYEGQRKDDPEHPVKAVQQSLDRVKEAVKKAKA